VRCGVIFDRLQAARTVLRTELAPRPVRVAPARLEGVLEGMAQSLSAGVTLRGFADAGGLDPLPVKAAQALRADIQANHPLSHSLERLGLLDPGTRAVVRAAERRGELPDALRLAAAGSARRRKLRLGLLLGLAYPFVLLVAAVLVLPLPLAFGKGGRSAYLSAVVPRLAWLAAAAALALLVLPRLAPSSPLRRALRWCAARTPVVRQAVLSDALATFASVLGACLKAGLPARESLSLSAQAAAPHPAFEGAGERLVAAIDGGARLVDALRAVPAFPAADLAQVGTAELSGTLDAVLPALEEHHRDRARRLWWTVAAAVGVAVFLCVVALLVAQIVSGWQGYFRAQDDQLDRLTR
jgi:type II secretory pathway component PulF